MENDGTVLVEETILKGSADNLLMPVSHTSMVFSTAVANQVAHFLKHGKFDRPEAARASG